ncbi:hypothetical protein [Maribacter hydrothermalis]|uniref:Uncharacterized protein n=1 Tax=Maribacter hydrothermalis TaxID=1836467 RepID=A0A1B7ZCG3_9FLAO|nr:hypothetical protein [Maribacter hydrothermalis]APQ18629.1 hypothetical protein BTR34_15455 [Maribacter hydrothermalis]OBR40815.1 hypothetical protein A9200_14595 [Maribacter hydrothermalis]
MVKRILNYLGWTLFAILLGFLHMRIVLGPVSKSETSEFTFLNSIHDFVLLYVGVIIGCIIALLFILLDIFYLKKRVQNNNNSFLIRLVIIIALAIIVGALHYILETIANVI